MPEAETQAPPKAITLRLVEANNTEYVRKEDLLAWMGSMYAQERDHGCRFLLKSQILILSKTVS